MRLRFERRSVYLCRLDLLDLSQFALDLLGLLALNGVTLSLKEHKRGKCQLVSVCVCVLGGGGGGNLFIWFGGVTKGHPAFVGRAHPDLLEEDTELLVEEDTELLVEEDTELLVEEDTELLVEEDTELLVEVPEDTELLGLNKESNELIVTHG
jgi:hypothetical protein